MAIKGNTRLIETAQILVTEEENSFEMVVGMM